MKHGWIILGLILLLIASVGILIYVLTQMAMSVPVAFLLWLLVFGILALVGGIAWLAGWLPRKKIHEPKPHSAVIETPKAEPRHLTEEEIKTEPSQTLGEEARDRGSEIIDIEGIGPVYAKKLNSVDIFTTSDLLEAGATPRGRRELAEKTGTSDKLILRWINMADLFRIRGVGEEYSDLLEMAGVDTVVEFAKRVPENLHAQMLEVNEKKNLVRRPPALNQVKQWIEEAKKLPRKIEY